ncbi:MAG TPA: type I restriction enzyme HsdR N-terminal domain-containing protein [Candidatus Brocadiia bacterium]
MSKFNNRILFSDYRFNFQAFRKENFQRGKVINLNKASYEPLKEEIGTEEIFDLVFKDSTVKYGLQEFSSKEILKRVTAFEKEDGRFYVRCLKRDKDIFIYDKNKKKGKPEEVIRQLWLIKLIQEYKYPLDRIEVEKSVQFGREVRAKSADIVLYKQDKITPYIIFELKQPNAKKAEEQLKSYLSAESAGRVNDGTVKK